MRYLVLPLLLLLTGCIADQNNRQQNQTEQSGPTLNIPAPRLVPEEELKKEREAGREAIRTETARVKDELKQEIQASSNNTQNQLSGLVNASVSKLAEKITGVEAKAEVNVQATAKMAEKMDTVVTNNAVLETKLQFQNQMIASLQISLQQQIEVNNDLRLQLEKMNLQMQGVVAGIAGVNNKVETISTNATNTAGRDVNYLPKEAVDLFTYWLGGLFSLATLAIMWIGRNARLREKARTVEERDERQKAQELLIYTLSLLPEAKSADINMAQARVEQRLKPDRHGYGWFGSLNKWWQSG